MPLNQSFAGHALGLRDVVEIFAVIKHIDIYRACFRLRRGRRGEILQVLRRGSGGVRRGEGPQHGGGCSDAVDLITERPRRQCRKVIDELVEILELQEQRASANEINLHQTKLRIAISQPPTTATTSRSRFTEPGESPWVHTDCASTL